MNPVNQLIAQMAGPAPVFDRVTREFLRNNRDELFDRLTPHSLVTVEELGGNVPWLYGLTFATRGLVRGDGDIRECGEHKIAVRFLPDYLRRADRSEMLLLIEPREAFHPNLRAPAICLQVYPGEPLIEICESIHSLVSWRLRNLREDDALNPAACAWGRANLDRLPLDDRPLFGRNQHSFTLEPVEE
jgi:hypothetical protein